MYRRPCSCSTRALEAFLSDFANISIKARPRPQQSTRRLHTDRPVDAISLQTSTSGPTSQANIRTIELAPVLEPATSPSTTNDHADSGSKTTGGGGIARTKAESRMLRKLKRIQDGSHNKTSSQDEKLVGQVKEMLLKIEEEPGILGGLVGGTKEEKEVKKVEKEKARRGRQVDSSKRKWATEGIKRKPEKSRKESIKSQIANNLAGESTVSIGDEESWEHIQDQWTEEPEFLPDDATNTKKKKDNASKNSSKPDTPPSAKDSPPPKPQEPWGIQKRALEQKFGKQGWQPRKRLSPDTLSGIRALHASNPTVYNVEMLRQHFKITPEAIRRILKSKWRPNQEEIEDRMARWEKRGIRKWSEMAEQGQKPPKKWRVLGVPNPKLGKKKMWDSNSGVTAEQQPKTEEAIAKEEGLFGKARRMENAQRMRFKESLAGRIL